MTHTEAIVNQSVIDAVSAKFVQARPFSIHWDVFMSPEQKRDFFGDVTAFVMACEARRNWLAQ